MSQPLDLSQFPDLPSDVVKAFAAMQFELSVERAARQHEQAVVAEKEAFIGELKALIEKLEGQIGNYRQAKFGPKSEKLNPAQLELALEDLETAIADTQAQIAAVEEKIAASERDPAKQRTSRAPRKSRALPESLPRVERVIEPGSIACPCGCGDMVRIGEDRTERLDYIPARYQVIVTVRPRYACPKGRTGVAQAKAPAHLLEGSWPTEALLAQIAVSKYSEHMPLNRQAVVMTRHGVPIDRSVLADWMGRTGALIAPVVDHMAEKLTKGSSRLYVDETTAPVLDPGRGRTKTGYLWRSCEMIVAGAVLRRPAWCSITGPDAKASMQPKSLRASMVRSRMRRISKQSGGLFARRMPMGAILIWPHRNVQAANR